MGCAGRGDRVCGRGCVCTVWVSVSMNRERRTTVMEEDDSRMVV